MVLRGGDRELLVKKFVVENLEEVLKCSLVLLSQVFLSHQHDILRV